MIGFTVFVMVVFETFKWWRGDGNYCIMIMNIRYAIRMLKILRVGIHFFYITDKPLNEVLKCHAYFKQNNHAGFLGFFCCFFACLNVWVVFLTSFFSDEADVDNEISREIDVMLENIQNSL